MKFLPVSIVMSALLICGAAIAQPFQSGMQVGAERAAIAQTLAEKNCQMGKFEYDGAKIEVYARCEGGIYELKIDAQTGVLKRWEREE